MIYLSKVVIRGMEGVGLSLINERHTKLLGKWKGNLIHRFIGFKDTKKKDPKPEMLIYKLGPTEESKRNEMIAMAW